MIRILLKQRLVFSLALAVVNGFSAVPAWSQVDWGGWEDCDVQIHLSDDEDFFQATTNLWAHILEQYPDWEESSFGTQQGDSEIYRVMGECILVAGSGPIELTVELVAEDPGIEAALALTPPLLELRLLWQQEQGTLGEPFSYLPVGAQYRELMYNPQPEGRQIEVILHSDRYSQLMNEGQIQSGYVDALYGNTKVVWTLRRLEQGPCAMWAKVGQDVSKIAFGDVAFWNYFEWGVQEGAAGGTALDPTAHEALEGLGAFANWANEFLDDEDDEEGTESTDDEDEDSEEEYDPYAKSAFYEAMDEEWGITKADGDNFGLSLAEVQFDVEGSPSGDQPAAIQHYGMANADSVNPLPVARISCESGPIILKRP